MVQPRRRLSKALTANPTAFGLSSKPSEMQRVISLPQSALTVDTVSDEIIDYWTNLTRRAGSDWRLRKEQALALHNLFWARGLVGAIGLTGVLLLVALLLGAALGGLFVLYRKYSARRTPYDGRPGDVPHIT